MYKQITVTNSQLKLIKTGLKLLKQQLMHEHEQTFIQDEFDTHYTTREELQLAIDAKCETLDDLIRQL